MDELKRMIKNLDNGVKINVSKILFLFLQMYFMLDLFEQNDVLKKKTKEVEDLVEKIEKADKGVNEIELTCEEKIKEEQKRDEKIDRIREQKNKLENDLENLISEIGSSNALLLLIKIIL